MAKVGKMEGEGVWIRLRAGKGPGREAEALERMAVRKKGKTGVCFRFLFECKMTT